MVFTPNTDDTGMVDSGGIAPGTPRKCPLALRQEAFCLCAISYGASGYFLNIEHIDIGDIVEPVFS